MKNIHFIAIGGSAMHNLALALASKGYVITGSDDAFFEPSKSRLAAKGILPATEGWFPEKITSSIDAIILGMHAHADNPELQKAQELGIKIYSYPEFLYEQSKDKTRVVIAGSHGKTSITSMILHVALYAQLEVDYMVGALLEGFDTMVKLTHENEFMVLEGDEYLTSPIDRRPKIHWYKPNIALISGIAWDHINVFPTFENYIEQFSIFLDTMVPGGALIYNEEDIEVKKLVENHPVYLKKFPYSTPEQTIIDGETSLITPFGEVKLQIFGKHNLLNLEGARLICNQMGITDETFYEAIGSFKGAAKRLEKLPSKSTIWAYKDYAHAPSKVSATTQSVREQFPDKPIIATFELHTYSSLTPEFLKEYAHSLDLADQAIVYYSEDALKIKRMEPLSIDLIKESFANPNLLVFSNPTEVKEYVEKMDKNNKVFLIMSSGNYGGMDLNNMFL